jgi:hypothetical protein
MILVLKLLLTPILITLATLAGRRWGPAFSGWFIGFPLTSGPVSVILALQYGAGFAAHAAVGNLGGLACISVFCLAYTATARVRGVWASLGAGVAAYLLATFVWMQFSMSLGATVLISLAVNGLVIWLIPRGAPVPAAAVPSRWDIPARIVIATAFVFALTTSARVLGPQLSGLITPFPIFGSVLAVFAHRQQGPAGARHFLRGHAISLFGFAAFFLVVGALLPALLATGTYLLATLAAVAVNGLTLRVT